MKIHPQIDRGPVAHSNVQLGVILRQITGRARGLGPDYPLSWVIHSASFKHKDARSVCAHLARVLVDSL